MNKTKHYFLISTKMCIRLILLLQHFLSEISRFGVSHSDVCVFLVKVHSPLE